MINTNYYGPAGYWFLFVLFLLTARGEFCVAQPRYTNVQHFNSENGLPQNSIKGIRIDRKGYIWLGTEGGLVRYDGKEFKLLNKRTDGTQLSARLAFVELTADGKTVYIKAASDKYYKVSDNLLLEEFMPAIKDNPIENQPLVAPYRIFNKSMSLVDKGQLPGWIMPDLQLLERSAMGSTAGLGDAYYYFNKQREMIVTDTGITRFHKLSISGLLPHRQGYQRVPPASVLQFGGDLYIREGEYIYKLRLNKENTHATAVPFLEIGPLPNISAFAIYPEMNLYIVGTLTDGVYLFSPRAFNIHLFKDIESNIFYAHAPFRGSFVTPSGILPAASKFMQAGLSPYAILQTKDGRYLFNRRVKGEMAGIEIRDSLLRPVRFIGSPHLRVSCMLEMDNGDIWIAPGGRFIGKLEQDSIRWLTPPQGLDSGFATKMEFASASELWLAGPKWLAKFNPYTGAAKIYPGFKDLDIRTLHMDKKGILWIGTYGNGYYAFFNGKTVRMPADRNNYLSIVHSFVPDGNGYCWITTNQGLFQAKMTDLYSYLNGDASSVYYQYYDRSNGLLTNEFNGGCSPSGLRLKDGTLSFPSMRGIVQFDPRAMRPVFSEKNIYIDRVQADSVSINPAPGGFTLPARTEMLQVAVSSPYFGTPYNHAVFYRVRGLKTSWQPLPQDGQITLNRLAKGKYTLELKKPAGFGNRQIETRLAFTVSPTFYETWWFRIAAGIAALGILWLLFRLRLNMLLQQKRRLQSEVNLATQEQQRLIENLEIAVSDLERSQEELYKNTVLQEKLARIITHDLQSPLRFLSNVSERINREVKNGNMEALPELSRELQRSSAGIYRFVQDFGLWVNAKGRNFKPVQEPVVLAGLVKTLQVFFQELAKRKKNILEIQIGEDLTVMADPQMMLIMLRNIIDNANKYTSGGRITVAAAVSGPYASVSVTDTGGGFSAAALARVREQIANPDLFEREKDGSGYGYRFIADFIKVSEINISITSTENQGTTVTLGKIPVAENDRVKTKSFNTSIRTI